MYKLSANHSVD